MRPASFSPISSDAWLNETRAPVYDREVRGQGAVERDEARLMDRDDVLRYRSLRV